MAEVSAPGISLGSYVPESSVVFDVCVARGDFHEVLKEGTKGEVFDSRASVLDTTNCNWKTENGELLYYPTGIGSCYATLGTGRWMSGVFVCSLAMGCQAGSAEVGTNSRSGQAVAIESERKRK